MTLKPDISGIIEAQKAVLKAVAAVEPRGGLGRAIQFATVAAHRSAVIKTHVITGALRASHLIDFDAVRPGGDIYINPDARNPRTGQRTAVYGPIEHARGGSHAFYQRVIDEEGETIGRQAIQLIQSELP